MSGIAEFNVVFSWRTYSAYTVMAKVTSVIQPIETNDFCCAPSVQDALGGLWMSTLFLVFNENIQIAENNRISLIWVAFLFQPCGLG